MPDTLRTSLANSKQQNSQIYEIKALCVNCLKDGE